MSAIRRRAWWYLVAVSVLIALFGVGDLASGIAADPGITAGLSGLTLGELQAESATGYRLYDFATRSNGLSLLVLGVLLTTILLIPYRAGMRWAWFSIWTLPAWSFAAAGMFFVAGVDTSQPPPPPMVSGPVIGSIAVLVLLLDWERFSEGEA